MAKGVMEVIHKHIDVAGTNIHCLVAGDSGSPVILLHGGGLDSAELSWGKVIGEIARFHRVFAPDWPGYGDSSKPEVRYTTEYFVFILDKFMRSIGLAKASIVGFSMGGAVSIGFAVRWPERVRRLILVDSYGLGQKASWWVPSYLMIRVPLLNEVTWWLESRSPALLKLSTRPFLGPSTRLPPETMDKVARMMRRPAAGRAFRSWQKTELCWRGLRTDYMDRLDQLRQPVLVLHGRQDTIAPLDWVERAVFFIKDVRVHIVDGCGHWLPREAPGVLCEDTIRFLDGLPLHDYQFMV